MKFKLGSTFLVALIAALVALVGCEVGRDMTMEMMPSTDAEMADYEDYPTQILGSWVNILPDDDDDGYLAFHDNGRFFVHDSNGSIEEEVRYFISENRLRLTDGNDDVTYRFGFLENLMVWWIPTNEEGDEFPFVFIRLLD